MNRFRMSDRINRYWLFHFLLVYMEKLHFQISVLNWEKIFFKIENQESIQKLLTDYNSNILNIAVTRKTNKQCDITNTVGTFRLVEDTGKISLAKKRLFESSAAWDLSCMNMQHFRIRLLCVQTPVSCFNDIVEPPKDFFPQRLTQWAQGSSERLWSLWQKESRQPQLGATLASRRTWAEAEIRRVEPRAAPTRSSGPRRSLLFKGNDSGNNTEPWMSLFDRRVWRRAFYGTLIEEGWGEKSVKVKEKKTEKKRQHKRKLHFLWEEMSLCRNAECIWSLSYRQPAECSVLYTHTHFIYTVPARKVLLPKPHRNEWEEEWVGA